MPELSDQLKSLGVKIGARDLPQPKPANPYSIENVLGGREIETHFGRTFVVEETYPFGFQVGDFTLGIQPPLHGLAAWANDPRVAGMPLQAFAFLDTETTGLSGGTGTYAFLIGVARFESDHLHLLQIFMRDPVEEPAQLAALEDFLAPTESLVTFNGKSFDIPLLTTRYLNQGWRPPYHSSSHVDLLHLSRKLWKDRLPSRTLGNLEVQVLRTRRTEQDIPGWIIPQMYFDYLRSADARPLLNVFYHNAMDVVSLAALFQHTAALLHDPIHHPLEHGVDVISLGKLFEDLGEIETATNLYLRALSGELPEPALLQAVLRLAAIHKKNGNYPMANELWETAVKHGSLEACVELAKAHEHHLRNVERAIAWTEQAIAMLPSASLVPFERNQWLADLNHRLARLYNRQK